jgi:protein-glucosylgalactosylhydroxylysine glucosidase
VNDTSSTWLEESGWPLLSGIGDFWVSKATPAPARAKEGWTEEALRTLAGPPLVINGVIPPDEYANGVNNSV